MTNLDFYNQYPFEFQSMKPSHFSPNSASIDKLLIKLLNASPFSADLRSILTVDTTCLSTCKQIYVETVDNNSESLSELNQKVSQLIEIIESNSHAHMNEASCEPWFHQRAKPQTKKDWTKRVKTEEPNNPQQYNNDENINRMNFPQIQSNKNSTTVIHQTNDHHWLKDLKEINRVEYRKPILPTNQKQSSPKNINNQEQPHSIKMDNQEQSHPIKKKKQVVKLNELHHNKKYSPVNQLNESAHSIDTINNNYPSQLNAERRVSPKVELQRERARDKLQEHERESSVSNISSIGKNYQTQTDLSFEIDLRNLGIESNLNQAVQTVKTNKLSVLEKKRTFKTDDSGIQEEEPWECDEEEIEEELRKINERLSCQIYQTPRSIANHKHFENHQTDQAIQKQAYKQKPLVKPQKIETKTVKLSLTPLKKKIENHSKNTMEKSNVRNKSQELEISNLNKRYQEISYLMQEEPKDKILDSFEPAKWNKHQKRRLLTEEIQMSCKLNPS